MVGARNPPLDCFGTPGHPGQGHQKPDQGKPTNLNLEFLSAMVNGGGQKSTPWFFRHSRPSWTRSPKAWSRKPTNLNLEFLSAMVNGGGEKSTPWFFRHSRPSWTRSPKAWSRKPTNLNLEFLSAMVNGGGEKSTPWFFRHSRPSWTRSPKAWSREADKSKLGIPLCHGEWWGREIHPLILSALQAILDKVTKSLIKGSRQI